jgi:hypothetical protein
LPFPGLRWGSVWLAPEPVPGRLVGVDLEEETEHVLDKTCKNGLDTLVLADEAVHERKKIGRCPTFLKPRRDYLNSPAVPMECNYSEVLWSGSRLPW